MTANFKRVFNGTKPIIGMVHIGALPGSPLFDPSLRKKRRKRRKEGKKRRRRRRKARKEGKEGKQDKGIVLGSIIEGGGEIRKNRRKLNRKKGATRKQNFFWSPR